MNKVFSIPLLATRPHSCSYLATEIAQTAFVHPSFPLTSETYAQLITQGFRRCGDDVYQNICPQCSACIPARVNVAAFKANRHQQRCLKKNVTTYANVLAPIFVSEHYELYIRYQRYKHADSSMQHSSPDDYIKFLSSTWCNTRFVEFFSDEHLIAVAVVDLFSNALSAVYTFFNPDFEHLSPGKFVVLWQIQQAQALGLEWLYLGYWIANCRKMSYKNQYQPLQLLVDGVWQDYPHSPVAEW